MAKTMKAAVVREFGKPLTIDEVPVPEPGPGMIQVAIRASGVCHTDLHAAEGDWPVKPSPPFIPGHEGVGYVSGVGAGVKHVEQAIGMVARGGTVSLNGLPPGDFPLDIFGMVLNGITVRGSIVGTRLDLQESLDFAGAGKVRATVARARLEDVNDVFARMHKGQIEGRIVLDLAA
jgi:D-arabinose 1-dehydrogenase-like Zn-dependent alcohol dehydrogenase